LSIPLKQRLPTTVGEGVQPFSYNLGIRYFEAIVESLATIDEVTFEQRRELLNFRVQKEWTAAHIAFGIVPLVGVANMSAHSFERA